MSDEILSEGMERINVYVTPETKEWLVAYKKSKGTNSLGKVIDHLVYLTKTQDQNKLVGEIIADEVSEKILGTLKEPLDILRRRTGYSDRQTKVITETLNHMVSALQIDKLPGEVITTKVNKTNVLSASELVVKEQLDHFAQQAATKRKEQQELIERGKSNE